MTKAIQRGSMDEGKIYIPTLWCKEPFCVFTWMEGENFTDLQNRYEDAFKYKYGSIEEVLRIDYPEDYEELWGIHLQEIDNDDLGESYYLISRSELDSMDPQDFLKYIVCIPQNWFSLSKFYIEYILPLRCLSMDDE